MQLFTIYAIQNERYVSLVFRLLPNKMHGTYISCFQLVIEESTKIGVKFQPYKIISDFEESIHKVVRLVWNNIEIVGCRFRLVQAWMRKIQCLITEYKSYNFEIGYLG